MEYKKGFFAYSSQPEHSGEFIEEAIKKINSSNAIKIASWKDMSVNGNYLIKEILQVINQSDFFCADLTGMNDNVLLELGFALSRRKPIFLLLDTSHSESVKRFKEFNLLSTVGYSNYHNTQNIVDAFQKQKVYESKEVLIDSFNSSHIINEKALFYIKAQIDTNYSQEILSVIESQKLPITLDDPVESKTQPLSWYVEQLKSVPAALVEFSAVHRSGHEFHNSKCAFIAGLALGFDLKTLMVAEKPYPTSIDYQEFLRKYTNRQSCRDAVQPFIYKLKENIAEIIFQKKAILDSKDRSSLQKINFGEYIAEHETENLYEYFIETAHYDNIIKPEHNIVIGRKGAGKTATFYFLQDELGRDTRNHICVIKPINFEIDGLVSLYKDLHNDFEKGYMTEAIWKFLIYTEIAKSLYLKTKDKALYALSQSEERFLAFVDENKKIILPDFSSRLEQQIQQLKFENKERTQAEFKIRISEILHDSILGPLKVHFRNVLTRNKKLIILIDNLDKSWRTGSDIGILSKFILGLLGIVGRISVEFKGKPQDNVEYSFHLILFLRSDIFKYIMSNAREPDKIEFTRLRWNDPEIFFRLIEERFTKLSNLNVQPGDLWNKFLPQHVEGVEIRKWITNKVLPRPRDIIYLFNVAKDFAISRGHQVMQSEDVVAAHKDYSNWAFKSIIVENGISIEQMESFMYQLMGESAILSEDEIKSFIVKSMIDEHKLHLFIDHLVSLSILGREVAANKFEYEYDFDADRKLKALADKLESKRYKLHEAFIPYLECK